MEVGKKNEKIVYTIIETIVKNKQYHERLSIICIQHLLLDVDFSYC